MSDKFGQQIQVFVRCRPMKPLEKRVVDLTSQEVQIQDGKIFSFDRVFDQESSQDEVYRHVVKPLVDQVVNGFNCTVFAYGQTGTGKTYTMEGLIPLAINHIYKACTKPGREHMIRVSYLELYNEEAYDLLTDNTTKLKIYDDLSRKGCVNGCTEQVVMEREEIHEILRQGSIKRQTNATLLNACSSRSHTIFNISVTIREGQLMKSAKLNLVDLAGSENIGRSGAQDKRAREAGNINQSLLTLGRVIMALSEGRSHIPYRESKLTRILQDSLGGATRTSMIATISPAESDLGTTLGTLEYASQSRSIVNLPEANRQMQATKRQGSNEMDLEMRVRNEVAAEFKREIKNLRESYDLQFLDQKTRYEQSAQAIKSDYEKEIEEMQAEIDEKQREIERIQQEQEATKVQLGHKQVELDEIQFKLDKMQSEVNAKQTELEIAKNQFDLHLDEVKKQHEVQLIELKNQYDLEMEKVRSLPVIELDQTKNLYEKEIDQLKQQLAAKEEELRLAKNESSSKPTTNNDEVVEELKRELEAKTKQIKVEKKLAEYRETLVKDFEAKLKEKELEISDLRDQLQTMESPEEKKASRIPTHTHVSDEYGDYANMTFDGGDELLASAKKARKKVGAGTKKRVINPSIMLSGKKKKLKNNDSDTELSPVAPPPRVTRSRATRKKLDL